MIYLLNLLLLINQVPADQTVSGGTLIDWVREIRQVDHNGEHRADRIIKSVNERMDQFGQAIESIVEQRVEARWTPVKNALDRLNAALESAKATVKLLIGIAIGVVILAAILATAAFVLWAKLKRAALKQIGL